MEATLQSSAATMLTKSRWKLRYKVHCLPKARGSYTTKFCCYNAYQKQVKATLKSSVATMLTKSKWKLHYKVLLLQCLPKASESYTKKFCCYNAYQSQVETCDQFWGASGNPTAVVESMHWKGLTWSINSSSFRRRQGSP